jgi:hypothetical protein
MRLFTLACSSLSDDPIGPSRSPRLIPPEEKAESLLALALEDVMADSAVHAAKSMERSVMLSEVCGDGGGGKGDSLNGFPRGDKGIVDGEPGDIEELR